MPKQGPGEYKRKRLHDATVQPSLKQLGIEKTEAHRWQTMAKSAVKCQGGRCYQGTGDVTRALSFCPTLDAARPRRIAPGACNAFYTARLAAANKKIVLDRCLGAD